MRRWTAGARHDFDGITGAIYPGRKEGDDLVLHLICRECGTHHIPKDELVFFMADFLAENEEQLLPFRPHWRKHGDTYFMEQLADAIKNGWRGASERVRRQRERRRAA